MTEPLPSLQIQSVVYNNAFSDIAAAVEATANSARYAQQEGVIGEWVLLLGDCGAVPFATEQEIAGLADVASASGGSLAYTHFGENLGSAGGHNALAAQGASALLIILNPDAHMAYDTISRLTVALLPDVGLVESRQVPVEHPKDYERGTGLTSWGSTACAMTPRSVFDKLGGFDAATFFLYCDDVDYSWRARLAGYSVRYEPSARLFHDKRLTLTGDWPVSEAELYYSAEAALLLAHKYSRPDIVAKVVHSLERSTDLHHKRALAEFMRRRSAGELPSPIDPDHRVAQFEAGNYAVHRF